MASSDLPIGRRPFPTPRPEGTPGVPSRTIFSADQLRGASPTWQRNYAALTTEDRAFLNEGSEMRICVSTVPGVSFRLTPEHVSIVARDFPRKVSDSQIEKFRLQGMVIKAAAIAKVAKLFGYASVCRCTAMNDVAVVPDGITVQSQSAVYGRSMTFGTFIDEMKLTLQQDSGVSEEEARKAVLEQLIKAHFSDAVKCSKKKRSTRRKRCKAGKTRSRKTGKCVRKSKKSKKSKKCRR